MNLTMTVVPGKQLQLSEKQFDEGLDDLVDYIFAESQSRVPVDESTLKKSGGVNRKYLEKTITYLAPHASPVEFGSKPHWPPYEPLIGWAERVLGQTRKEARETAWFIMLKIHNRGTEAQPYLRPAVDMGKNKADSIFAARLKR
jgi:hypothetical protein